MVANNDMKTCWLRKGKCLRWIGLAAWLAVIMLFIQHAVASRVELQPRAALISWIVVILLALPLAAILIRRRRGDRDR